MSSTPKLTPLHSLCFMERKIEEENKMCPIENNSCNGCQSGGWGLIHALCNTSNNIKEGTQETQQVYVHPLALRNSSTLSSLSLEMCTESLGSETGSEISENSDDFASMLMETDNLCGPHRSKPDKITRKFNRTVEFPPPLSSISGGDGVVVRSHREGGRLVLEAFTLPPSNVYFQAERVDGRLRLFILNDNDNYSEESDIDDEEIDGVEYEHEGVEEGKCKCKDIEDGEEDDDGKDGSSSFSEDKMKKIGCEIDVGEFRRLSRCKEGRNREGVTNCWETCLAIS